LIPGARNTAFILAVAVVGTLADIAVDSRLSCGDLPVLVLAAELSPTLAGSRSFGIACDAVADAAGATTGAEEGLVSGDVASFTVSLAEAPPQGRHDTSLPRADGALVELRPPSVSLPLPPVGADTFRDPLCLVFDAGSDWAMLSLRMTLPRLPSRLPLERVGLAVTSLRFVPAAVRPSGLSASWLGLAFSV
jgi:hypothetical protein